MIRDLLGGPRGRAVLELACALDDLEDVHLLAGHREDVEDMYAEKSGCGFSFGNGCSSGSNETNLFGAPARKKLQTPTEVF